MRPGIAGHEHPAVAAGRQRALQPVAVDRRGRRAARAHRAGPPGRRRGRPGRPGPAATAGPARRRSGCRYCRPRPPPRTISGGRLVRACRPRAGRAISRVAAARHERRRCRAGSGHPRAPAPPRSRRRQVRLQADRPRQDVRPPGAGQDVVRWSAAAGCRVAPPVEPGVADMHDERLPAAQHQGGEGAGHAFRARHRRAADGMDPPIGGVDRAGDRLAHAECRALRRRTRRGTAEPRARRPPGHRDGRPPRRRPPPRQRADFGPGAAAAGSVPARCWRQAIPRRNPRCDARLPISEQNPACSFINSACLHRQISYFRQEDLSILQARGAMTDLSERLQPDDHQRGLLMINRAFLKSGHTPTLLCAFFYFDMAFMVWALLGPLGVQLSHLLHLTAEPEGADGGAADPVRRAAARAVRGAGRSPPAAPHRHHHPVHRAGHPGRHLADRHPLLRRDADPGPCCSASPAPRSRWRCRWPRAGTRREYQGFVLGIAGAGNSGTVLAALFAPTCWRRISASRRCS